MRRRGAALAVGVDLADLSGPNAEHSTLVELRWSGGRGTATEVRVPSSLADAIDGYLKAGAIVALDGPQGLAGLPGAKARACERALSSAACVGHELPAPGRPSSGFVAGSVRFFASLNRRTSSRLHGTCSHSEANLIEVCPAAGWPVLAERKPVGTLAKKAALLERRRLTLRPLALTGSFVDAVFAALAGACFRAGAAGSVGHGPWLDHAVGLLREGYIVQPLPDGLV